MRSRPRDEHRRAGALRCAPVGGDEMPWALILTLALIFWTMGNT